ncbi:monovalent cation/H+ antiporter subunit D [Paracoccus siganidrum]|uniref:Monovalent cation/H+ antiporter subunit D n=1 Tax=Paracoccus siganidrum TaxID=1276757 RepID=A0A419A515_9RHOB|nr:monovalent cation/H+ antiporter subunit D [Paracoccus siganidrum]RJL10429.1 monovalent cation/H+ antiporter subunit D [Paracoccus siganidrum]RMC41052.1 monovalent cation/H+ antiporter subunit D [Paracoccus siganidrum]
MSEVNEHLIIAPILIPFIAGAVMLLYDDRQRKAKMWLSLLSAAALLFVSIELLDRSKDAGLSDSGAMGFYLLGDWMAPWGIVLVIDRLAAMMLVLTSLLAIPSLIYATAGWQRQGQHFHSLFQFLLMGLNGAFLTGDLFNLFVFFEVLLAASYGLMLHGSGQLRIRAGLHYIAINLAASLLFLLGVSLIYGITGTLNMAHLANLVSSISEADRPLFHAAIALLSVAFLVKAGSWPLSFWLPTTYMAAAAPVGAMFAIMTKVGVYVILRLSMLFFGQGAGPSAGFGAEVLIFLGMATILFGLIGVLSSQGLGRMAAFLVLISSGTVLGVTGFAQAGGGQAMLAGALYYLMGSTLATGALFLLIEPMSREDGGIAAMLALTADAYGLDEPDLDDPEPPGFVIPGTMTVLGVSFVFCVLVLAGMPPLAGFVGKVAMISALLDATSLPTNLAWGFVALLILSGFATLIGLARIGVQTFWASEGMAPRVPALEVAPVVALMVMVLLLTFKAQVSLRYMEETAAALNMPRSYAYGVFSAPRAAHGPDTAGDEVETEDSE